MLEFFSRFRVAAERWGVAALTTAVIGLAGILPGCGVQPASGPRASSDSASLEEPDPAAVLAAAYEAEGAGREVIFIDVAGASQDELDETIDRLSDQLDAIILPAETAFRGDPDLPALTPTDPETGKIGVSFTLTDLAPLADGRYQANLSYARSGLDGGDLVVTLQAQGDEWVVTDISAETVS